MPSHYHNFYTAVHLLPLRGDEVLLYLRQNTGWMDGHYGVVAGHLDGNESATEGMIREAKEEAGITIRAEDLHFASVCHRLNAPVEGAEYIDFFFTCSKWEGKIVNAEPHKCSELAFYPLDKLPTTTVPYIRKAIEQLRVPNPFFEFGWPAIKTNLTAP